MRNLLENFAILLVGLLSLSIVFFIVQYNLIEDDSVIEDITSIMPAKKVSKKATSTEYLSTLEGYGDDVDVKVDATKENRVNTVTVKSELRNDHLGAVVDDKSKSSYMENLATYSDNAENTAQEESVAKAMDNTGKAINFDPEDPEKLEVEEIVDEIGMAIDAALDDL